ncbi:MAG TPA: helix-turn-helix transcriptional regulator, partial [Thermoanaerobaculia bacterium]|nr:helix-turn-helix transcriptional regulator [Thermoanaerobaculia bacterium]
MESGWERKAKKLAVVLLRYLEDRSQREFEAASGVDQARISRYERGKVQPSRPTLERMAESAG